MLLGHLLCGLIFGWLASLASFLMEFSVETMLWVYVLGTSVGMLLGLLRSSVISRGSGLIGRWTGGSS